MKRLFQQLVSECSGYLHLRCHPWSSAFKTEEKQGNHRILNVQNACFEIEIKREELKRLQRSYNQGNHRILNVQNACFEIEIKREELKRLQRSYNQRAIFG
jgi:CRISPR/Cas system-associated endoribonuclease Cas2